MLVMAAVWVPTRYYTIKNHPERGWALAHWLSANLPEGTRVGAYNAGILGYYCGHPVINLDGVVNNVAFRRGLTDTTATDEEMFAFLREEGAGYLTDWGEIFPQPLPEVWRQNVSLVYTLPGSLVRVYRLK